MTLAILTPTGDRPEAFALCERWMARQTHAGPRHWIVVDDGQQPVRCTLGQQHVHRPDLRPLPAKVAHALTLLPKGTEALAIVEDDDWYGPEYLSRTLDELERSGGWAAGETRTIYYHVGTRQWMANDNTGHASLCQTVIGWPAFGLLAEACNDHSPFVDCRFWPTIPVTRRRLYEPRESRTLVGIKGMPGRPGYGSGHAPDATWQWDPNLRKLRELIGQDADAYAEFHCAQR